MHQTKELLMRVNILAGRLLVAVGLVALLVVPATSTQKGKPSPPPANVPLNVVFADGLSITDDVGDYNPITEQTNGPYSDGSDNVRAEMYYGNLYFDTNENKGDGGRRVYLTFPDSCSNCPDSGPKDVYVATTDGAVPQFDLAGMKSGDIAEKRCAISWAEAGYTYYLRHTGSGELGDVSFECMGGTPCTEWVAAPTGSVGLYRKAIKGGGSETYLETLEMPFQMTLTKR
jgi:hypothetical protein